MIALGAFALGAALTVGVVVLGAHPALAGGVGAVVFLCAWMAADV